MSPVISVIVPVYQVEDYLERCITSVLRQSFSDFELILVDDGSTDKSGAICDRFAQEDSRVRVIHQQNGGLSDARNSGTREARGAYLTYLDSDDFVSADYLSHLYQALVQNQADVCACDFQYVWEDRENSPMVQNSSDTICISGREAAGYIVKQNRRNMIVAWGKLYDRKLIPYLTYPKGKVNEDEFVTYRVLYEAKRVAVTEWKDYYYLQRMGSIMGVGYSERRLDKLEALEKAVGFFQDKNDAELVMAAKQRYLLNLQIAWYRVWTNLSDRCDLLNRLQKRHSGYYRENRREVKTGMGVSDRFSLFLFRIHPKIYGIFARLYLKLFPDC